jgi:hypothetical protein
MRRVIFLSVLAVLEVRVEPDTAAVKVSVASHYHFLGIVYIVVNHCSIEVLTTC